MIIRYKFITILFLLILSLGATAADGPSATGSSISEEFDMTIVVSAAPPYLNIITPIAGATYITNKSMRLDYESSGATSIWYNIDMDENKTIENSFNTSEGIQTIYLYANGTSGMTVKNRTFNINSSALSVIYEELMNAGQSMITTDFDKYSLDELENLHDIKIDNLQFGKISFLEGINISDDFNVEDRIVDLDSNIDISFNRIEVNSINLPNFNKSAELELKGLSFNDPRILKDGNLCGDCTIISYDQQTGDLKFLVNSFSIYSVEETPVQDPDTDGSSGGGGGGSASTSETSTTTIYKEVDDAGVNFFINETLLKVFVSHGEISERTVMIINNNDFDVSFVLESENEDLFMNFEDKIFTIKAGETEFINFNFFGKTEYSPGVYMGKIIFKSNNLNKEIPFVLAIEQKESLFDVSINLADEFSTSYRGDSVFFTIDLFNVGAVENEEVSMETFVIDPNGKKIFSKKESFIVKKTSERTEELLIPKNAVAGTYSIFAEISYSNNVAIANKDFLVKDRQRFFWDSEGALTLIAISLILILIIIGTIIIIKRRRRMNRFLI